MLRRFLDTFGFEYEFISATEFYKSGRFDATLRLCAERYDAIMAIMLASLREERQQTYSCFLPIHPETGRVMYVPMKEVNAKDGTITFDDETGREWTLPVTGGQCEAAVEAGLWRALGGAGCGLRDVREGPQHEHSDLRRDLRGAGGAEAEPYDL
jgi:lysyl-tRNA synthetase class 1